MACQAINMHQKCVLLKGTLTTVAVDSGLGNNVSLGQCKSESSENEQLLLKVAFTSNSNLIKYTAVQMMKLWTANRTT